MAGRVFAVVGPSGAGKDTVIAAVAAARPDLHVVRRVITRPEAAGGEPFEGVTEAEFARRRAAGDFALDWQAHGLSYGIPAGAAAAAAQGGTVIFNGSRAMLAQAAAVFPGLTVLLVTARPVTLAARLAARGRESAEDIARRLDRLADFSLPEGLPTLRIDNDGPLEAAVQAVLAALQPAADCGAAAVPPVRA
ncbi:phosphonate metabolism protein/1,5-bisphosphokinase (PRPP-forming) PhnN [Frigidibacter oleivorans]|uniref:phosphonate metabolism protein/1,5-bisphosphokinase (PRPP-forming) PhnN n=1 Tax=Frigidibacter oleivorans TaxID=2487129 RepID=UPI000F8CA250|nr:phosphonate metabolism protein/1,5-bisphosphokinase (PRPP-forming) PhnN [Frigidibacter oleivorans]